MLNSLPPKKNSVKVRLPGSRRIVLIWFYPDQIDGVRATYINKKWYFTRSGMVAYKVTHWAEI